VAVQLQAVRTATYGYWKTPTAFQMKISNAAPSVATTQPTTGAARGQSHYAGQREPQGRAEPATTISQVLLA